jgi:hypothetical protein
VHSAYGASVFARIDFYLPRTPDDVKPLWPDHRKSPTGFWPQLVNDLWAIRDLHCPPTRTWSELIGDLQAIRNLDDDWDGQGAVAPHPALVDGAITLLQSFRAYGMDPPDRVIAGVNGTVFFEWHGPGGYLEIEVTAPDQAEARSVLKVSNEVKPSVLSRRS